MGIDPSQPKGDGSEHSSSQPKENNAEGVSGLSDLTDADWEALFNSGDPVVDPLHRELGIAPDGVVGEHVVAEVMDALERRIPDKLLQRAMPQVLGETEDGRVVVSLEFRRPEGSLIPGAHLIEGTDPSEPGGFRGAQPDKKRKIVVTTLVGNGALDERDWESVPGQVMCLLTQRYPGQCSDGFTMELKASSMAVVEHLFSAIAEKDRKDKPSAARHLLDRYVVERLVEETGGAPQHLDYILISPLEKNGDGIAKLTVVVAVQPPGYDCFHAIEGRDIEVGLSAGKRVTVANGTWYHRGPAAAYVEELERREQRRREGAD